MKDKIRQRRSFKGVWFPSRLWLSTELSLQEKAFIVEIDSLDNEDGCFASNAHFSDFSNLSKRRVIEIIKSLEAKKIVSKWIVRNRENKRVEKRILRITRHGKALLGGGEENFTRVVKKASLGHEGNDTTPGEETCTGSNTIINKPINNNRSFPVFWDTYDHRKGSKLKAEKKWSTLSDNEKETVFKHLEIYKANTPDRTFRKQPITYLNSKLWESEGEWEVSNSKPDKETMSDEKRMLFYGEETDSVNQVSFS